MDESLLKKILSAAGVKDITPEMLKAASQAVKPVASASEGTQSNFLATGANQGTRENLDTSATSQVSSPESFISPATREAVNSAIIQSLTGAAEAPEYRPIRYPSGAVRYEKIRTPSKPKYGPDSQGRTPSQMDYDWGSTNDPLRGNRLDDAAARNVAPQKEAARRQELRDKSQLPIAKNIAEGKTGRDVFQDSEGRIEGPKQLKERLIREGASQNEASIAAMQRYNDMFSPKPGTFGYTGPSAQTEAVRGAFEKGRAVYEKGEALPVGQRAGDIAAALRDARKVNLETIAAGRMADPNRKPVGLVTAIESNGQVIAKRGEGDARVINAGTYAGSVEETPGKLELTPAGERLVRDRTATAKFNREVPLGGVNGVSESISSTAVTGRYGTAVGRQTSLVDELKASGKLPADFKLTDAQKTGQAPLPTALVEARKAALSEAKTIADTKGTVSDPATRIAMGIAGRDGVARIDNQADNTARMESAAAEAKRNDAALQSMYSPQQMAALDKTISQANKTGGVVFDKGGGNFAIKQPDKVVEGLTAKDDELVKASKRKKKEPSSNI